MHKPGLFGMNGFMVFLLTCLSVAARGQQPGFLILIDAENKQAFTIRVGDQFYSSTSQGHLVLAQLKDSSYRLNLIFPKSSLPEKSFPVVIHHKDLGFQLRGADTSWVLYNWQTKETIHPVKDIDSSRILDRGVKREDGFSKLMAAVVADSSVMYNTYTGNGFRQDTSNARGPGKAVDSGHLAVKSLSTTKTITPLAVGDQNKKPPAANQQPPTVVPQPVANQPSGAKAVAVEQGVQKQTLLPATVAGKKPGVDSLAISNKQPPTASRQPPTVSPRIKKLREVSLKISRKIVYQDMGKDGLIDTITLFVFFETTNDSLKRKGNAPAVAVIKPAKTIDTSVLNKTQARNKQVTKPGETTCIQNATDEDVAFLRSAILKANSEDEKIGVSSAAFAMKCFTVGQVRLLASLFVSDKDKYRLMDAARLHVSDREHFRELVDMLTDKNFQRKFLVMADKRS